MNEVDEILMVVELLNQLKDGKADFETGKKIIKVVANYPEYFIIDEPIQKCTDYIYNIRMTELLNKKLLELV